MPWLKILLLLPCLVVDFRDSALVQLRMFVLSLFEFIAIMFGYFGQIPRGKRMISFLAIVILLWIGSFFQRWILELTNYIVLLTVCTVYYNVWEEFAQDYFKNSKFIAFIAYCLVVLMNDWKLTVDAIKNGEILVAYTTRSNIST